MNLTPLQDRLIIKPLLPDLVTSFGFVLADTPSKHENKGTIVAIGRGRLNDDDQTIPMDVKLGDLVVYQDGDDIIKFKHGGLQYVTIREDYIIGVLE